MRAPFVNTFRNPERLAVESAIEWAHGDAFDIRQFSRNGESSTQLLSGGFRR